MSNHKQGSEKDNQHYDVENDGKSGKVDDNEQTQITSPITGKRNTPAKRLAPNDGEQQAKRGIVGGFGPTISEMT